MQEVEGSTPTGGTCPNDFSDPIDQDIRTQWALSWKLVVSEWRSVIAVSLNVGGGVRLIKPAKLCMCTQNTTNTMRTDARCRVCAAMVPYRWATRGTSLRELEYTHTQYKGLLSPVYKGLLHTQSIYILPVYLSRDKLAIFTITVYVKIIVYMYLYIDACAQVFSAIWCHAESALSQGIG